MPKMKYWDGVSWVTINPNSDWNAGAGDDAEILNKPEVINMLSGLTVSGAELNYVDGVTSSIQGQINSAIMPGVVDVTGAKTLALADGNTIQKCNSASPITISIPLNAAVAFPINTEIAIVRYGAGSVYINPTTTTLRSDTSKRYIKNQYGSAVLKKIATDEWLLVGSIE